MADWLVKIDQSQTTAPNFPRSAEWWRGYLPTWFFEPEWWLKNREQWKAEVAVSDDRATVTIPAGDRRHATLMLTWLQGSSALQKYSFSCSAGQEGSPDGE
jgi:hypothetical protein